MASFRQDRSARNGNLSRKTVQEADDVEKVRLSTILLPPTFFITNLGQASMLNTGVLQIIHGMLTTSQWQEFSLYMACI